VSLNAIDRESALHRARRTGKLTRTNIEALEPRVLLAAQVADPSQAQTLAALVSAAAPAQTSAVQTTQQTLSQNDTSIASGNLLNSQPVDSQPESENPAPVLRLFGPMVPFLSEGSSNEREQIVFGPEPTDPSSTGSLTSQGPGFFFGEWSFVSSQENPGSETSNAGIDGNGGSVSAADSGGITGVQIVFVDPILPFPGSSDASGTNIKHSMNNGCTDSDGDCGSNGGGSNGDGSASNTGGTQQQSQGGISGSTGTSKSPTPSGTQASPPAQGNDSNGSGTSDPQGRPQVLRGNGSPPPIYDPNGAGGTAVPALYPLTPAKSPAPVETATAAVTPLE